MKNVFNDIFDYRIYFEKMGGFHDAEVRELNIDFAKRKISFCLADPLINFIGTKDYRAIELLQLNISFGVSFDINIDFKMNDSNLTIYDITVDNNFINIQFSPSGFIKTFIKNIEVKDYSKTKDFSNI